MSLFQHPAESTSDVQLTTRAVVLGSVLGFFLSFTNIYIGLKTGWFLGVNLTAALLAYSVWTLLRRVGLARTNLSILESTTVVSTASSAGYATGFMLISAFPAMLMLSVSEANPLGKQLPPLVVAAWVFFIGVLGVTLAIPMKRTMIDRERLKFPSGTAAALMLQGLHRQGTEALAKGRALFGAAAVAGVVPLLKDLALFRAEGKREPLIAAQSNVFDGIARHLPFLWRRMAEAGPSRLHPDGATFQPSDYLLRLDHGPALVFAGVLVGLRITTWMLVGALFVVFALAPVGLDWEWSNAAGQLVTGVTRPQTAWRDVGIWCGAPLLVASSLVSLAAQWRTIGKAIAGLLPGVPTAAPREGEVPSSWFVAGLAISTLGIVTLAHVYFEIPLPYGLLAIAMTFVLSVVSCRVAGESDIAPGGPLGKIMQLTYGVLIPQSSIANLQTAGISAGASHASADLLNDLKTGHLLGADPRRQFAAQALGIFTGTVASTAAYLVLVPDASALVGTGTKPATFPAVAAQQWKAVAELFKLGFGNLHPIAHHTIPWFAALGVVLALAELLLPKRWRKVLPSPIGLGIGMVLPFFYPFAMFLGAALGSLATAWKKEWADRYLLALAAGAIAGESIVGVIVTAMNTFVLEGR